jgi:hypothetical protein
MTPTIDFPPELEDVLRRHAAQTGLDMSALVVQAVKEKIARAHSFEAACAPFAEAVRASGMTDAELDRFFEEARDEVWQQRQSNS